jgi:hypothetical protein
MLRWVAVAALVLGGISIPAGSAQADDSLRFAVDDPAGDAGQAAAAAGFADIVHAEAVALEDRLDLRIQDASLDSDPVVYYAGSEVWLTFEYRGTSFDAVITTTSHQLSTPADRYLFGETEAHLYRGSGDSFTALGILASGLDAGARTYNATVPWTAVVDSSDFSPRPGEPVHLVGMRSFYSPLPSTMHRGFISTDGKAIYAPMATDSADFPDGTAFTVPGSVGDLSLATPMAVRYSNGEATTMQWPVEVANHGARDLDVALTMATGPGADARLPESVQVPAGGSKTVSVYATLPFAHEHGSKRVFPLTASTPFGDRTTLQLTVEYPAVPQPAGHHPDLYLHSRAYRIAGQPSLPGPLWMNALEDDPAADGTPEAGGLGMCPTGDGLAGNAKDSGELWEIELDPGLRIGLDGRVGEMAMVDLTLASQVLVLPGAVYARFELLNTTGHPYPPFELASGSVGQGSVAAPAPTAAVHLEVPMPPELDLVPPSLHDNLALAVVYCPTMPTAATLAVMGALGFVDILHPVIALSGGHLTLPLNEYHDIIAVEPGAGPTLGVDQAVVHARSGATVLWRTSATFRDGDASTYAVRLLGSGAPQAKLHASDRVRAAADAVALPVSLVVPDGPAGQVVEVVLDVTSTTDPGDTAALRLAVLLDPASTVDQAGDVAALGADHHKASPAPSVLFFVAALVLAALAVRRRQ